MHQIDILVLLFLLGGGWLGSLRSLAQNFIVFAGSLLSVAVASLYGDSLFFLYNRLFENMSLAQAWQPLWAATASTNSAHWQLTALAWLQELPWPIHFKLWVQNAWQQLGADADLSAWTGAVEAAFWRGLANICSFLTIMLLVKFVVTIVARISLKMAYTEKEGAAWPGFFIGLLQSFIMIFLIVALVIPFLIIGERTAPMFWPSFTFSFVRNILERFLF